MPPEGSVQQRLRTGAEAWVDYVQAHTYAWKMLFRDSGGGPEIQRGVVVDAITRVWIGVLTSTDEQP